VSISRLKRDKTVRNILADVSNAFYELRYIQKAVEIAGANLALNQELVKISQNAHGQDRGLVYDVSKAMAQTAQIQYDLVLLTELEQTEKTRLNTLLNRAPDAMLGKARQLPPRKIAHTLDEIYALAMTHQEDLLMAGQSVQRAEETIDLTKFETLPSFKLGLFYAGIGDPDVANPPENAGNDAMGVQVGMNIPLWFDKNSSRREKAMAALKKAKAEEIVAANTTKEQISRVWFKFQNARRLITLYETQLIPQAMASVQTAETWFREGNGSFADFIEIQATAYNFQLALERATTDYETTLVTLEQLAGVALAENSDLVQGGTP
jgi:outer membrane protein TolC